jgi:hypothetical protein
MLLTKWGLHCEALVPLQQRDRSVACWTRVQEMNWSVCSARVLRKALPLREHTRLCARAHVLLAELTKTECVLLLLLLQRRPATGALRARTAAPCDSSISLSFSLSCVYVAQHCAAASCYCILV